MKAQSILKLAVLSAALQASTATLAAEACDRSCLEGFVDRYLDAVIENKPSALPLAADVKFTEDGQRLVIGDGL